MSKVSAFVKVVIEEGDPDHRRVCPNVATSEKIRRQVMLELALRGFVVQLIG
jgi:hypothetical protein